VLFRVLINIIVYSCK